MTPQQEEKMDKIYELLAGTLEKKGLVHKAAEMEVDIKHLKAYKTKDEKLKNKVVGGIAVGTPILVFLWDWAKKNIFGL